MTITRLVPLAPHLVSLGLLLAITPVATAQGVPDPRFSTVDRVLVGNSSGTAMGDFQPGFDVVIRDVNNAPLPGHVVTLSFGPSGMKLYAAQNAGTTVDCAAGTVSRITNGAGAVKFGVRVAGYSNSNIIEVLDNGVMLAFVPGRSTDLDGVDGRTGLGDFVLFASHFPGNPAAQETDFDLNGQTGLGDFVLFSSEYNQGPAQPYCP